MPTNYNNNSSRFSDPPLEEKDIPSGVWLCHTCRVTKRLAEAAALTASIDPMKTLSVVLTKLDQTSRPATPSTSETAIDAEKSDKSEKDKSSRKGSKSSRKSSASSDNSTKNAGGSEKKIEEIVNLPKIEEIVEVIDEVIEEVKPPEPVVKGSALDELVRAASLMNPKQFELPRELSQPLPFPGTDRGNFNLFIPWTEH